MPARSAAAFTGETEVSWPRPRGRSGWVTTPSIWKPGWAIRWRNVGTANAGVPQKTIRSGTAGLPFTGFFQFADPAPDQIALQHAEVSEEEKSVEVIDFVAEGAREKPFAAHFKFLPGRILCPHGDVLGPGDISAEARDREASFLFSLLALGVNDFRICADDLCFRIFPVADINHGDAQ